MKPFYFLGIDTAKHKIRVALRDSKEQVLFEKDLPVSAAGLGELLARLEAQSKEPERFLVLIEATGLLQPCKAILQALAEMEARLRSVDQRIETLTGQSVDPQTKVLVESMPGFGPTTAAKVLAYLPCELLHSGTNRRAAARLQAFMGNDPRLQESGQWKGQTRMSKRGVETLRTAFFQAAFSAAQHDRELKAFYQRKRSQNKCHHVALSHLMRILTRRLVAVVRSGKPYQSNYHLPLKNAA